MFSIIGRNVSVTHTLVKLSVASTGHGWVVTTIDLGNVVALDVSYFIHCKITGKRYLKDGTSRTTNPFVGNRDKHQWDFLEMEFDKILLITMALSILLITVIYRFHY